MRACRIFRLIIAFLTVSLSSANACLFKANLQIKDINLADLVVVGRVENYQIILDKKAREERKNWLRNSEYDTDYKAIEILKSQEVFLTDYARFDIHIDEVLKGSAPKTITVVWDNSTFREPDKFASGPFLFALIDPSSPTPPLRGPSATVMPHPDGTSLSVMQAPCGPTFFFRKGSPRAKKIRKQLAQDHD